MTSRRFRNRYLFGVIGIALVVCRFGESSALAAEADRNRLAEAFAILKRTYRYQNPKWFVRPPADSAWIFSAFNGSVGTVEVGFQGDEIIYMVFRRGVGGLGWKQRDIDSLHSLYCKDLLRERKCGVTYRSFVVPQINAAVIVRSDFDMKNLF